MFFTLNLSRMANRPGQSPENWDFFPKIWTCGKPINAELKKCIYNLGIFYWTAGTTIKILLVKIRFREKSFKEKERESVQKPKLRN